MCLVSGFLRGSYSEHAFLYGSVGTFWIIMWFGQGISLGLGITLTVWGHCGVSVAYSWELIVILGITVSAWGH